MFLESICAPADGVGFVTLANPEERQVAETAITSVGVLRIILASNTRPQLKTPSKLLQKAWRNLPAG